MKYRHDFANDKFVCECIYLHKKNGYFVELGACNGKDVSQCYVLEKELNWNGLAVEPQQRFNDDLKKYRKNPVICAIGDKNDVVKFVQSKNYGVSGVKNALENHELIEPHKTRWRDVDKIYDVKMTTLIDLLDDNNAPLIIDYCCMDIEGSEMDVLTHFFSHNTKYTIMCMALEVGNPKVMDIMCKNGYIEIFNPFLKNIKFQGYNITWEKYFAHRKLLEENSHVKNFIGKYRFPSSQ